MTYLNLLNQPADTIDAFNMTATGEIGEAALSDEIERASEEQLISWLLENGITAEEIEESQDFGQSIHEIAQDLFDNGTPYPLFS